MKGSAELPIFKITVPITKDKLVLNVTGDFHYGVRGVPKSEILRELKKEHNQHKGNIFRVFTGDLIENNLTNSIGHGYDLLISDPSVQRNDMMDILKELSEDMYGKQNFKRMRVSNSNLKGCLSAGCCGNHEYRSRRTAGVWLDRDMYQAGKILSLGIQGIIELKIINKKIKMSRTYNIYVSHRPSKTNATSIEAMLRAFRRKKADVPGIDVFVFGHFHKRIIEPDVHFDKTTGQIKKTLYVVNPSPMIDAEYAEVASFSPLEVGHYINVFLPLDKDKSPFGIV